MYLSEIKNGETFKVAGIEFIKCGRIGDWVSAITKEKAFELEMGKNNNFKESEIYKSLKNEFLPKIINAVGEKNIGEIKTDLVALDGSSYGGMISKISIPTYKFYDEHRKIFDQHFDIYSLKKYIWLATANSTKDNWSLGVGEGVSGTFVGHFKCGHNNAVHPILNFNCYITLNKKKEGVKKNE